MSVQLDIGFDAASLRILKQAAAVMPTRVVRPAVNRIMKRHLTTIRARAIRVAVKRVNVKKKFLRKVSAVKVNPHKMRGVAWMVGGSWAAMRMAGKFRENKRWVGGRGMKKTAAQRHFKVGGTHRPFRVSRGVLRRSQVLPKGTFGIYSHRLGKNLPYKRVGRGKKGVIPVYIPVHKDLDWAFRLVVQYRRPKNLPQALAHELDFRWRTFLQKRLAAQLAKKGASK